MDILKIPRKEILAAQVSRVDETGQDEVIIRISTGQNW